MHSSPTLSLNCLMWKKGISYVQNTTVPMEIDEGSIYQKFMSNSDGYILQPFPFPPSHLPSRCSVQDLHAPLKLQCQLQPEEGAAHLCNPCRSSAAGPGLLDRYTGSCQEC